MGLDVRGLPGLLKSIRVWYCTTERWKGKLVVRGSVGVDFITKLYFGL